MDITLIFLFTLGVIAEVILLCYHKKIDFGKLKWIFLLSLAGVFLSFFKLPPDAGPEYFFLVFVLFFSIIFASAFRDKILPLIHEGTILSFTIVFWFVIMEYSSYFCIPFVAMGLLATLGTVILTFTKIRVGFFASVFFYGWFLFVLFFLGITQVWYILEDASAISPTDAFLLGMLFFYLIAHYLYIYLIISIPFPWPWTFSRDLRSWKKDVQFFANKYSNHQISLPVALLVVIIEGGALLLNHIYNFVPFYFLILVFLVIIPQAASLMILSGKKKKR